MNKSVLIGAVVALLAAFGYYQFVHLPKVEAEQAAIAAKAEADKAEKARLEAEAAAKKAAEEKAAAEAAELEAAKKAAEEAAARAAAEAQAAASAAEEAAKKAAEEAAAAAQGAAKELEEAARAAAAKAAEEAANAARAAQDGAAQLTDTIRDTLDPSKFDVTAVNALIDGSSLDAATKTSLKAALEAVKTNPALAEQVLGQIKAALGQ